MAATLVPQFGLATAGMTDADTCAESVKRALDTGYRHVDTAQLYENEAAVGRGIWRSSVDREDVFPATKVAPANLSPEDVLESTERSLARLGVDYLDLLYVHWPTGEYEAQTTLGAFDRLVTEGLIRHAGVSNFTSHLLAEARAHLSVPIIAHQIELHPLLPQPELVSNARRHETQIVAYSPLMAVEFSTFQWSAYSPTRTAVVWPRLRSRGFFNEMVSSRFPKPLATTSRRTMQR